MIVVCVFGGGVGEIKSYKFSHFGASETCVRRVRVLPPPPHTRIARARARPDSRPPPAAFVHRPSCCPSIAAHATDTVRHVVVDGKCCSSWLLPYIWSTFGTLNQPVECQSAARRGRGARPNKIQGHTICLLDARRLLFIYLYGFLKTAKAVPKKSYLENHTSTVRRSRKDFISAS